MTDAVIGFVTFANQPQTTVSNGGTDAPASGTSEQWTVASSASFPVASVSSTPPTSFAIADTAATSEIIQVTAVTSNVWGVTRGAEGTTPVAHSGGFTVQQVVTAGALQNFSQTANEGAQAARGLSDSTTATTVATYTPTSTDISAAGAVYDINVFGFLTTGATARTFTVALAWDGTTITSAVTGTNGSALPAVALARVGVWIEGRINCYSSTVFTAALNMQTYNGATPLSIANASTVPTTIATTSGPLAVIVTMGTASTAYAFTAVSSLIHRIA